MLNLRVELLALSNYFEKRSIYTKEYFYVLPALSWENEYHKGRRYSMNYTSKVNQPSITSLLPVINSRNPLYITVGNPTLKPEYQHNLRTNWNIFDQFSFTSFFTSLTLRYTKDKVTWKTDINNDLTQQQSPINNGEDYLAELSAEITTPIRAAKINITVEGSESYSRYFNIINDRNNLTTSLAHTIAVIIEKRKKEKLDISAGISLAINNSEYSLELTPKTYTRNSYFGEMSYRPNDNWHFAATEDVSTYLSGSLEEKLIIPLVKSEISRYFLQGKSLIITASVYDLLDRNSGIERISELNYFRERKSDIIGRYVMLSIKYRLNKFDLKDGVKIQMK